MRYFLILATKTPTGGGTASVIELVEGDFDEPLVPGAIVAHGGDDWRVDEVDDSHDPPTARLFRPPDDYHGSEPWAQ